MKMSVKGGNGCSTIFCSLLFLIWNGLIFLSLSLSSLCVIWWCVHMRIRTLDLTSTVLWFLLNFQDWWKCTVPTVYNKQKELRMFFCQFVSHWRIKEDPVFNQRYRSADPDPYQNVTEPEPVLRSRNYFLSRKFELWLRIRLGSSSFADVCHIYQKNICF
jgi:hypothetical protein